MKPILIFCHNYIAHNWYEIVDEQLELLVNSELYHNSTQINYGCYAKDKFQLYKFIDLVSKYDTSNKIKIHIHPINDGERQTMILMQDICKNYSDAYVLYYHTKGITSLLTHTYIEDLEYSNIESWRKCLEYFNIECWRECINNFENNLSVDTIGALYVGNSGNPFKYFYSGNFWWSKTSYLNNLPDMKERDNRMGCELWIGQNIHNWINLYPSKGGNIYQEYFDPKEYRKDLAT
jgi:hypothetical protein